MQGCGETRHVDPGIRGRHLYDGWDKSGLSPAASRPRNAVYVVDGLMRGISLLLPLGLSETHCPLRQVGAGDRIPY